MNALAEVRVLQKLSLPTLCELTFRDPPGDLARISSLRPGRPVKVSVSGFNESLFAGEITAVEHVYDPSRGREIRVRGYDLLNRLQKKQSVRTHKQVTLRDLVQQALEGLGIEVHVDETEPQWQNLVQYQRSDLDFLIIELSARAGLYFTLHENVLHLLNLAGQGTPLGLAWGNHCWKRGLR